MTKQMKTYVLFSAFGDEIHITNYGARLLKWFTKVGNERRNIILGYENIEDYLTDECYLGAIVGPYANRIKNSTVKIGKNDFILSANEETHHLHGGKNSISDLWWECIEENSNSLKFRCELTDGFNGYPGPMSLSVTYVLKTDKKKGCDLNIHIMINSKSMTIAGPTAHPYFNLSGQKQSINDHQLQVHSKSIAELDESNIPTGSVQSVKKTKYDFQQPKNLTEIGAAFHLDDNYFIQKNMSKEPTTHAVLYSPDQQLQLQVFSNYPSIQIYSGAHLQGKFFPFEGICLEPQFAPNSPNTAKFPFTYTESNSPLNVMITYRLIKCL